jgi:hypothetical protein
MQLYERASATGSLLCLSATETALHSGVPVLPWASGSAKVDVRRTRSTLQLMLHPRVHHADRRHLTLRQLQHAKLGRASLR